MYTYKVSSLVLGSLGLCSSFQLVIIQNISQIHFTPELPFKAPLPSSLVCCDWSNALRMHLQFHCLQFQVVNIGVARRRNFCTSALGV